MQTTKIYRLPYQEPEVFERLKAAQIEAALVWNECMSAHKECRVNQTPWLNQTTLQKLTKGKYELHSQSIQMVCQFFLANVDSTKANRRAGIKNMKYPWRTKRFYPVSWTAQAVKYSDKKLCFISGDGDKIIGLDLGIKDLIIAHDGSKTSKYVNPKHTNKYAKNLARKVKGSKTKAKAKKIVAKVHARITNARQDYLHKLSRKLTNESKVIVVENLNVRGMVRNRKLAKAISDCGWGTLVNFLSYKLERENKRLVEINRGFPSSHICPDCLTQQPKMDLSIREWTCINPSCNKTHNRDEAASRNIRAEGIKIIKTDGTAVSASRGSVRQDLGRKTKVMQHKREARNSF